jgi:hypothetical protein
MDIPRNQGLPDGMPIYLHTKNPFLSLFLRALQGKMLVFLWPFGIVYGYCAYFCHFVVIWHTFPSFGILPYFSQFWYIAILFPVLVPILRQEKSGNPARNANDCPKSSKKRGRNQNFGFKKFE